MASAETVKERFSCIDVADELGLDVTAADKTYCLLHDEDTPSLQLYDDHWYAYCCGIGGDVIKLVETYYGCSFRQAMDWFEAGGEDMEDRPRVRRSELREVPNFTALLRELTVTRSSHHNALALAKTGNPFWGVPVAGGIAIPHIHDLAVVGIKYRLWDGAKTSEPGSVFTLGLYVAHQSGWPYAIVCEGESDAGAVALAGLGADVFGLPSGASCWKDHWLEQLEPYDTVYVCMDNDDAGRRARDKIIRSIGYGRAKELKVPGLYDDAADALKAGWQPELL